MRYATLIPGFAILLASVVAAAAEMHRACEREAREIGYDEETIRRGCDLRYRVKPTEVGWACVGAEPHKYVRVKGGTRYKRDAICPD
jgi:hypothetical protein